jgi:hypothetical protein
MLSVSAYRTGGVANGRFAEIFSLVLLVQSSRVKPAMYTVKSTNAYLYQTAL